MKLFCSISLNTQTEVQLGCPQQFVGDTIKVRVQVCGLDSSGSE